MSHQLIEYFTDGGTRNNGRSNSVGSWGFVLAVDGKEADCKVRSQPGVTNNACEIKGVIAAYEHYDKHFPKKKASISTDSQYVQKGLTMWSFKWAKQNFCKGGKPIPNAIYWRELCKWRDKYPMVAVNWVRGHADCAFNLRVDEMCSRELRSPSYPLPIKTHPDELREINKGLILERKQSAPSEGEQKIIDYLKSQKYTFTREFYNSDLTTDRQFHLFFDFYLPDFKLYIEYDGAHHFLPINGDNALQKQKRYDQMKNEFCRENNLYLLRLTKGHLKKLDVVIPQAVDLAVWKLQSMVLYKKPYLKTAPRGSVARVVVDPIANLIKEGKWVPPHLRKTPTQ